MPCKHQWTQDIGDPEGKIYCEKCREPYDKKKHNPQPAKKA